MNEYEKIFNMVEYSDKLERLLKIMEDYKSFTKKKKIKYATMGRKNLIKLISNFYYEKFTTNKHKMMLIEVIQDATKIKYGNDSITDKKMFRLFSSAAFHAPNCKRIAMFAKFLQLGKRNLSNTIMVFYL
jgi:sulfur relay (sulfurtransferase) DsrC/TusE family protein